MHTHLALLAAGSHARGSRLLEVFEVLVHHRFGGVLLQLLERCTANAEVDASRALQARHLPALGGQRVRQHVDVKLVGSEGHDARVRVPHQAEAGDGSDLLLQTGVHAAHGARVRSVPTVAVVHQSGPCGGHERSRAAALHGRSAVQAAYERNTRAERGVNRGCN